MKSFTSTVLACAVILLSSLAPAHSADRQSGQTFKTFELDILPTEEVRRAPEEAVLKRKRGNQRPSRATDGSDGFS